MVKSRGSEANPSGENTIKTLLERWVWKIYSAEMNERLLILYFNTDSAAI
ncbi:hypothetical protein [Mucilaginibacter sp. 44-25]|nr:hypothetical protein [Mucilaginibacter sp. 44-25]